MTIHRHRIAGPSAIVKLGLAAALVAASSITVALDPDAPVADPQAVLQCVGAR